MPKPQPTPAQLVRAEERLLALEKLARWLAAQPYPQPSGSARAGAMLKVCKAMRANTTTLPAASLRSRASCPDA